MIRWLTGSLVVAVPLLLSGCAGSTEAGGEGDRARFVAPRQLAEAYSDVELRTMVAMAADAPCRDLSCEDAAEFRRQVRQLGARLAPAAREISKELGGTQPNFIFLTPAKREVGTLSNAAGSIVVFDGVRTLGLDETALAFLVAREMGHVISEHHEENSGISITVSVVASLMMPMATLLRGAATTVSAISSTSAAATAATTAASVAGAKIIKSIYRPEQLREADLVALRIMNRAGWATSDVADSLLRAAGNLQEEGWTGELLASNALLINLTGASEWPYVPPTMDDLVSAQRPDYE